MKSKVIGNKPGVKAQLCARGFEEEQNYRLDSLTCLREGLRCALSLIASKKWPINSTDVKTAFLQGKNLERNVCVRPPKEAYTNKIWKLNKCVYGLTDASRCWFLKVREERCKLGARPSQLDQGLFTSRNQTEIDIFHVGTKNSHAFTNVGLNTKQNKDMSITIDQQS